MVDGFVEEPTDNLEFSSGFVELRAAGPSEALPTVVFGLVVVAAVFVPEVEVLDGNMLVRDFRVAGALSVFEASSSCFAREEAVGAIKCDNEARGLVVEEDDDDDVGFFAGSCSCLAAELLVC